MLLSLRNLTKIYGNKVVLDQVELDIQADSLIGLLGPNGSGKTTLIKLINHLITPTSGYVLFKNKALSLQAKYDIAYLPERTYLNMNQKVKDSVKMFNDFYPDFNEANAQHILSIFEIPLNKRLQELSKGQKGKVNLALVMGRNADLYVLDEPLDGIDPASREFMMKIIMKYKKPGSTVILSTHQILDIEGYLEQAILLKDGRVIDYGNVKDLTLKHHMSLGNYFKEVYKYDEKII